MLRSALRPGIVLAVLAACGGRPADTGGTTGEMADPENAEDSNATDTESDGQSDEDDGAEDPTSSSSSDSDSASDHDSAFCMKRRCDPGRADECPEGQKCAPWSCGSGPTIDSSRCVDLQGDRGPGESCTPSLGAGGDECGPTLICLQDLGSCDSTPCPGVCHQLCAVGEGDGGNCDELGWPGAHCFAFQRGTFPVCLPTCDPFDAQCEDGESCYLAADHFICMRPVAPDGGVGDPGREGDECSTEAGCEPGLACVLPDGDHWLGCEVFEGTRACRCAALCDLRAHDDPRRCPGEDQRCVPLLGSPVDEVTHVGLCQDAD